MTSWKDFESELVEVSKMGKDQCKFGTYIESLGENSLYVDNALENKKITNASLYRALKERGMTCGSTIVDKHRSRNCSCYKDKSTYDR